MKYKVYAKLDENNCIVSIESNAFHTDLLERGYIQIDEDDNGYIYGHAQPNYLRELYGQPTYDENGLPNYLYEDKPVLLTDEEKAELYPTEEPLPTQEERLQALESAMLDMILGGM